MSGLIGIEQRFKFTVFDPWLIIIAVAVSSVAMRLSAGIGAAVGEFLMTLAILAGMYLAARLAARLAQDVANGNRNDKREVLGETGWPWTTTQLHGVVFEVGETTKAVLNVIEAVRHRQGDGDAE